MSTVTADVVVAGNGEAAGGPAVPRAGGAFVVLGAQATRCAAENYQAVRAAAARHGEPCREVDPASIG
ncbi:hypothetical protein [Streptomyces caatingaensis]|uniref:hypothetical protein n=1 Tax=Streptomyces caatingaensis TaxID=1678637 RepID=UPI0012FEF01B|nr:hypothetical protein [Streptomyces caatingaensis]